MTAVGFTASSVADHVGQVEARVDAVAREFTHPVRIVAVTKGFGEAAVAAAAAAGCTAVGENYAQDLLTKRGVIERLRLDVHFIGRLQSNKVRQIADLVTVWETLDRESVVREVAKRAPGARVFVQVNATGEADKGGCPLDEVADLTRLAADLGLVVEGLMTIGPTGEPPEAARAAFRSVRRLVDELGLQACSMGMTADLEVAVGEGATEVRVGSALFGPRPPR